MNHRNRDRAYMMSLNVENILRSLYLEAGLIRMNDKHDGIHWGWVHLPAKSAAPSVDIG